MADRWLRGSGDRRLIASRTLRFLEAKHPPTWAGDEDFPENHFDGDLAGPFLLGELCTPVFFQSIDAARGRNRRVNGIDVGVGKIRYGHEDQLSALTRADRSTDAQPMRRRRAH